GRCLSRYIQHHAEAAGSLGSSFLAPLNPVVFQVREVQRILIHIAPSDLIHEIEPPKFYAEPQLNSRSMDITRPLLAVARHVANLVDASVLCRGIDRERAGFGPVNRYTVLFLPTVLVRPGPASPVVIAGGLLPLLEARQIAA